jgi:predicted DNA binding protein
MQEIPMNTELGVWIDHRKAVVVAMTGEGTTVNEVLSEVEKQPRRSGDSPLKGSYEAVQMPADDRLQSVMTEHLNIYYDAVIDCFGDTESIFIFGPGEAKNELEKRLEGRNLGGHIVGIETVDRMTDRQVVAKVRQQFVKSH